MALTRRIENKYKSRESILRASRRLFREKGFEEVTIDDIADKAGVSRATVYNYFPGKDSLLLGIARAELDLARHKLIGEWKEEPAERRLRYTLEQLSLDSIEYLDLSRKIIYLNSFENNPLYPTRGEILEIFTDLVEECKRDGTFRLDVPTKEIVDIVQSVYLTVHFGWTDIGSWPRAQSKEKVNNMLTHVLGDIWALP